RSTERLKPAATTACMLASLRSFALHLRGLRIWASDSTLASPTPSFSLDPSAVVRGGGLGALVAAGFNRSVLRGLGALLPAGFNRSGHPVVVLLRSHQEREADVRHIAQPPVINPTSLRRRERLLIDLCRRRVQKRGPERLEERVPPRT